MNDFELEPETRQMLELAGRPGAAYDPDRLKVAAGAYPLGDLLADFLGNQHLKRIPLLEYRRFCLSLTAVFRKYSGQRLALEIEVAIARWQLWGLDPSLLQRIAVEAWNRLCEKSRQLTADSLPPDSSDSSIQNDTPCHPERSGGVPRPRGCRPSTQGLSASPVQNPSSCHPERRPEGPELKGLSAFPIQNRKSQIENPSSCHPECRPEGLELKGLSASSIQNPKPKIQNDAPLAEQVQR